MFFSQVNTYIKIKISDIDLVRKLKWPKIFVSGLFIDRNFKNTEKDKACKTFLNGIVDTSKGGDNKIKAATLSPKPIQHRILKDASGQIWQYNMKENTKLQKN